MFRRLFATRFAKPMGNGRNKACLIECIDLANQRVEVVVKFTGCESGVQGLIRETLAAFFAADLGLQVPEPILVEVIPGFRAGPTYPEVDALIARSSRYAFGSAVLPSGYSIYSPVIPVKGPMIQRAAEIFAFDTFVANLDRHPGNPNCLMRGEDLVPIDHDLAFLMQAILLWKEPWVIGGADGLAMPDKHIFWLAIKNQNIDFTRLCDSLKALTDERLAMYLQALPDDWMQGNNTATEIVEYIKSLRRNADGVFLELQRALQ